ncbi:hypothetical protein ACNVED_00765 [Legionella sp. D16C41]|uniref:hypothetical protein n=1 Tax=Legionella sp. D16C41 TaxID=3402688 RepID=UPI003AF55A16
MATNFFSSQGTLTKRSLVDIGHEDCGFRAVAAAIIDNVLSRRRLNQPLLVEILEQHSKYFTLPQAAGLLTPAERLLQLINRPETMAKFVAEFAYTLRQITVSQLCKDPVRYWVAFSGKGKNISPEYMRKPNTPVDKSAFAALADALGISITISVVSRDKELPLKLEYGPRQRFNMPEGIHIQLEDPNYIPYLRNNSNFQSIHSFKPVIEPEASETDADNANNADVDPAMEAIHAQIAAEERQLLADLEENMRRLNYLISDNKITKEQLLNIYIKGVKNNNDAHDSKYVGIEHGNESFFAEFMPKTAQRLTKGSHITTLNYDGIVMQDLVRALAEAISTGQLAEDFVYDSLNQPVIHKQSFR